MILGLDGATFDIIHPMVQKGLLPNLQKLIKSGVSGTLWSSLPPLSPVAWTSMATGVNPGKHGLTDFVSMQEDGDNLRMRFLKGSDRQIEAIWSYLTRNGKKSIVINVPMTYPPELIDGIMISGMDAPDLDSQLIYPPELKSELLSRFPEYRIDVTNMKQLAGMPEKVLSTVESIEKARLELGLHLMQNNAWDFCMLVLTSLDRVQHLFLRDYRWENVDVENVSKDPILSAYILMDKMVGLVLDSLDSNTTLFVVSDHGFGPAPKKVSLNQFLISNKYLSISKPGWATNAYEYFKRRSQHYYRIMHNLKKRFTKEGISAQVMLDNTLVFKNVNWSHTSAYSLGSAGNIYINKNVVSDPVKIQELKIQIKNLLFQLKDPDTGIPVIHDVKFCEEIYFGPYIDNTPDIIVLLAPGFEFDKISLQKGGLLKQESNIKSYTRQATGTSGGDHLPNGIMIAEGKFFKKGHVIESAEITDIAPTVLHLLGLSVPVNMDGDVIRDILDSDFMAKNPINYSSYLKYKNEDITDYSDKQSEAIEERLKDLGYL